MMFSPGLTLACLQVTGVAEQAWQIWHMLINQER